MLTDSQATPRGYENLVARKDMGRITGCFLTTLNTYLGVKTIKEPLATHQGLCHAVSAVLMITVV